MKKKLAFMLVAVLVSVLIMVGNAAADTGTLAKAASEGWHKTFDTGHQPIHTPLSPARRTAL